MRRILEKQSVSPSAVHQDLLGTDSGVIHKGVLRWAFKFQDTTYTKHVYYLNKKRENV
jgi:hypothetical protein